MKLFVYRLVLFQTAHREGTFWANTCVFSFASTVLWSIRMHSFLNTSMNASVYRLVVFQSMELPPNRKQPIPIRKIDCRGGSGKSKDRFYNHRLKHIPSTEIKMSRPALNDTSPSPLTQWSKPTFSTRRYCPVLNAYVKEISWAYYHKRKHIYLAILRLLGVHCGE